MPAQELLETSWGVSLRAVKWLSCRHTIPKNVEPVRLQQLREPIDVATSYAPVVDVAEQQPITNHIERVSLEVCQRFRDFADPELRTVPAVKHAGRSPRVGDGSTAGIDTAGVTACGSEIHDIVALEASDI